MRQRVFDACVEAVIAAYGGPGIVTYQDASADASDDGDAKTGATSAAEDRKPAQDAPKGGAAGS